MSVRRSDPDRQSVYYAERTVFTDTEYDKRLSEGDFIRLFNRLFEHDWWERHNIPIPVVEPTLVEDGDSPSYALLDTENVANDPILRIAEHQVNACILAHEASHLAAYHFYKQHSYGLIECHGREYRATFAAVAEIVLGVEAATKLRKAFSNFIKVRPEHAPGMPGSIMTVPRPKPEHDPFGVGLLACLEQDQLDRLDFDFLPQLNGVPV